MKGRDSRRAERGGCLAKLLIFVVFAGAVLALAWMLFLPMVFTRALRQRTGFDATVTSLAVNPVSGRIVVRGLVISNPPTFPVKDGLQLAKFEADAELGSYFGDALVIDELVVDVTKVTLVKRADGHTNLEIFQQDLAGAVPLPPSAKARVLVQKLRLKVDTLVLADYSERKPQIREHRLGFDQTFTNVSELKQLMVPAVLRSLVASDAAGGLGNFLPRDLGKLLGESVRAGESWLKPAETKATDSFRGFLDKLEEMRKP